MEQENGGQALLRLVGLLAPLSHRVHTVAQLCYSIPFVLAPKKNKYSEKSEPTPNPTRDISPSPHARPDAYEHPITLCLELLRPQ